MKHAEGLQPIDTPTPSSGPAPGAPVTPATAPAKVGGAAGHRPGARGYNREILPSYYYAP